MIAVSLMFSLIFWNESELNSNIPLVKQFLDSIYGPSAPDVYVLLTSFLIVLSSGFFGFY